MSALERALDQLFRTARTQNKWLPKPVTEAQLRDINRIQGRMLIKAGSTLLVPRSPPSPRLLKEAKVVEFKVVEMAQGQKTSRFIAWTYHPERQRSL